MTNPPQAESGSRSASETRAEPGTPAVPTSSLASDERAVRDERRRRRSRFWKRWRRRVLPRVADIAIATLGILPPRLLRNICRGIAFCAIPFARPMLRTMEERVAFCLADDVDRAGARRIARRSFIHFAGVFGELASLRNRGPKKVLELVDSSTGMWAAGLTRELCERTNSTIWVTGHFGNWEIGGSWGTQLCGAVCVARRYPNEEYQRIAESSRKALGIELAHHDEARRIMRQLRSRRPVALLVDLDAHRFSGVFVPFFGRPAYTHDSPAKLALSTGASLLPMVCVRNGPNYEIMVEPPIDPADYRDRADPIYDLTAAWVGAMESIVRRHPDQWVWMSNRWTSTPETVARRRERERLKALAR